MRNKMRELVKRNICNKFIFSAIDRSITLCECECDVPHMRNAQ